MSHSDRGALAFVLALAGIVLAWTPVFAPLHEMMHTSSAMRAGCRATWEWRVTHIDCPVTDAMLVSGYMGELIFWSMASLLPWLGIFAAGYVSSRYVYAFMSSDFARLSPEYIDRFTTVGAILVGLAIAAAVWVNAKRVRAQKRPAT